MRSTKAEVEMRNALRNAHVGKGSIIKRGFDYAELQRAIDARRGKPGCAADSAAFEAGAEAGRKRAAMPQVRFGFALTVSDFEKFLKSQGRKLPRKPQSELVNDPEMQEFLNGMKSTYHPSNR